MKLYLFSALPDNLGAKTMEADRDGRLDRAITRALSHNAYHMLGVGVGPAQRWNPRAELRLHARSPILDLTRGPHCSNVVSDRFKEVLEAEAPGDFQFLPVRPTFRGNAIDIGTYWVANPLRIVDALNLTASSVEKLVHWEGMGRLGQIIVNPALVPKDVHAFVLRYDAPHLVILKENVYRAMRKARLKGVYGGRVKLERETPGTRSKVIAKIVPMPVWKDVPVFEAKPFTEAELKPRKKTAEEKAEELRRASLFVYRVLGPRTQAEVEVGKGCTRSAVKDAERALGIKLTTNFKQFLTTCGASSIGSESILALGSKENIVSVTRRMRAWLKDKWPRHMVVISEDGRGGCWCLDLSKTTGDDCPVVYNDHELNDIDEAGKVTPHFQRWSSSLVAWIKRLAREGT